jgi:diacylglycerol kinase (ATP)
VVDIVVVINPQAGGGSELDSLRELLSGHPRMELRVTEHAHHATELALEAAEAGVGIVAAAGGDGTIHEVVKGLLQAERAPALGLIPLGTGNDLARSLDIEADPEAAVDLLLAGHTRWMDLVHAELDGAPWTCINAAAGGFAGQVGETADEELKRRWGPLSYVRSAIEAMGELSPWAVRLDVDGRSHELDALNVVIANGRFAGHGIPIAPRADPFDGMMNVAVVLTAPILQLSRMLPKLLAGEDPGDENFLVVAGRQVSLEVDRPMPFSVDGELVEATRAGFRLEPGALRVVVPRVASK